MRSKKNGGGAVRLLVNPDEDFGEVGPQPVWRQVKATAAPFYGAVIADLPLFPKAMDV